MVSEDKDKFSRLRLYLRYVAMRAIEINSTFCF